MQTNAGMQTLLGRAVQQAADVKQRGLALAAAILHPGQERTAAKIASAFADEHKNKASADSSNTALQKRTEAIQRPYDQVCCCLALL